jgi:hypothetical protein
LSEISLEEGVCLSQAYFISTETPFHGFQAYPAYEKADPQESAFPHYIRTFGGFGDIFCHPDVHHIN